MRIGDSRAILAGVARILVQCGHPRDRLVQELQEICGSLSESSRRWNPDDLEYVAKLPDVVADWNDDPVYLQRGKPRALPLNGRVSITALVLGVLPKRRPVDIIRTLIRIGAVEKRRNLYYCMNRHLVFNGGIETYLRALLALHGILRTLERNLAGESTLLEQAAISARIAVRDRPVIDRLARERGLPVLFGMDAEMRRRARHAAPDEPRAWAGLGMYVIDNPFDHSANSPGLIKPGRVRAHRKGAGQRRQLR